MRSRPAFVAVIALVLSSCSSGPPALPEDLIGSAATCAVVSASQARAAVKDPAGSLPIDEQSQIVHYALLAGAAEPAFSRDNANAVVKQMQMVADRLGEEEQWKPLIPLCKSTFPDADLGKVVTLPAADEDAQLQCYALGDFMVRALSAYGETYRDSLSQYNSGLTKLEPMVEETLTKKGLKPDALKERNAEKSKALALAAKIGPPAKVLTACLERFPPDKEVKLPPGVGGLPPK